MEDVMKFKLLSPHYIDDRLLPEGAEIGDGCAVQFRDAKGEPLSPTSEMEPIDDEAKRLFSKYEEKKLMRSIAPGKPEPLYPKLPDPKAPVMGPKQ